MISICNWEGHGLGSTIPGAWFVTMPAIETNRLHTGLAWGSRVQAKGIGANVECALAVVSIIDRFL